MNHRLYRRLIHWIGLPSLLGLGCFGMACGLAASQDSSHPAGNWVTQEAIALPSETPQPTYQVHETARSRIHVIRLPGDGSWQVVPRVAAGLLPLEQFAEQGEAIALINAGFFDPANQLTTSAITQAGALVADPRQNPRLIENPDLAPYLERILNRAELRRLSCNGTVRYAISRHRDPVPENCQMQDALGAGPRLLPALDLEAEGFREVVNGQVVRDALGSDRPNARSAVGLTADGDMLLVMAAQRPEAPQNSGLTLPELAQFLASQGAVEALNLDGGSSAGMVFQGMAVYGRLDASGQTVQRPIKSVLAVVEATP